mgnify:CR=1 FL=1
MSKQHIYYNVIKQAFIDSTHINEVQNNHLHILPFAWNYIILQPLRQTRWGKPYTNMAHIAHVPQHRLKLQKTYADTIQTTE